MNSNKNEFVRQVAEQKYEFGFTTDVHTEIIEKGLNEDIVRLISQKKGEPDWMLEFRLKAFRHWQTMRQPEWGHLTLPPIDYQAISYYADPTSPRSSQGGGTKDGTGDSSPSGEEGKGVLDPKLMETFDKGEIVAVNDEKFDDKVKAIQKIEEIGASYAIGRDANVGDTIIGIKGRVGFEAAAPKLIIEAHRLLEKSTLSKWQQYWKDQVANWYGMFLHESQYLEPVMPDIEAMLTSSQRNVTGTAILKLRPYGFETVGIDSANDLTKSKLGEYGETQTGWTADEAKGFIKVSSTPLRVYYGIHKDEKR